MKFIPNRIKDYIVVRLFAVFIKAYLPLIVASLLSLAVFFKNAKLLFYISSVIIVVSLMVINVLVAVYWRYFISTARKVYIKVANFLAFISMSGITFALGIMIPFLFLNRLEDDFNNRQIIDTGLSFDLRAFLIVIFIGLLSLIALRYANKFFKLRARNLLINRDLTDQLYKYKIIRKLENFYQCFYSFGLSTVEKVIFNKDVKEVIRKSKYILIYLLIQHAITIGSTLYFYFATKPITVEDSIISSKIFSVLTISSVFIIAFVSKISFRNHINIEDDFEVLQKYNIKFEKKSVIKAKTRIISSMISPKIYLLFSVFVLVAIVRFNFYLALIYIFSAIEVIFIKKTLELWSVKSVNGLNSNSELMSQINGVVIIINIISFITVYKLTDKLHYLLGHLLLILVTAGTYLFHLYIYNTKNQKG